MMTKVWVFLIAVSVIVGGIAGRADKVSMAAVSGAAGAVELILTLIGVMALWSGIMAIMSESGLSKKIAKLLKPILRPLFGRASRDEEAMEAVASNMTANLLGLANAATPMGLKAADRIYKVVGEKRACDEVITLIVINTASLQLIPTTVAAVRASFGSPQPYDILIPVWISSFLSISAGIIAVFIFKKVWKR